MSYGERMMLLGNQYLAQLWLAKASKKALRRELSECRNSPTLQGEGAAVLIRRELERRGEAA